MTRSSKALLNWVDYTPLPRDLGPAGDWFKITGRGKVATFSERMWSPPPRVNEHVLIDGVEYIIRGVEKWQIMSAGSDAYWDVPRSVGLLVALPFGNKPEDGK